MTNKPKQKDGRASNHGHPRYEEKKSKQIGIRLTQSAYDWIKNNGGADLVEKLSRGLVDVVNGEVVVK